LHEIVHGRAVGAGGERHRHPHVLPLAGPEGAEIGLRETEEGDRDVLQQAQFLGLLDEGDAIGARQSEHQDLGAGILDAAHDRRELLHAPGRELLAGHRLAQVVVEPQTIERAGVHLGVEYREARTALLPGLVERQGGVADDRLGGRVAGRAQGDAGAHGDEELLAIEQIDLFQSLAHALEDLRGGVGFAHVVDQHAEHVLRQDRDGVHRAGRGDQAVRGDGKQLIVGDVPEALTDRIQAVDADQDQAEDVAGAPPGPRDGAVQAVDQQGPVGQAGDRFGHLAIGDVADRPGHAVGPAVLVTQRGAPNQGPAVGVVVVADPALAAQAERDALQVRGDLAAKALDVLRVDQLEPGVRRRRDVAAAIPEDLVPTVGIEHQAAAQIPVPEAVVGAGQRQGVALLALLDRHLGGLADQLGADPGQAGREVDRLGDVVVGAQLERIDHVLAASLGGDHDDRQVAVRAGLADLLEHVEARDVRHHPVEQHQVEDFLRGHPQGLGAVLGHCDVESLALEAAGEHVPIVRVVVDDQQSIWL